MINPLENLEQQGREALDSRTDSQETQEGRETREVGEIIDDINSQLNNLKMSLEEKRDIVSSHFTSVIEDLRGLDDRGQIETIYNKIEQGGNIEETDIQQTIDALDRIKSNQNNLIENEIETLREVSSKELNDLRNSIQPVESLKESILSNTESKSVFGIGLISIGGTVKDIMNYLENKYKSGGDSQEESGFLGKLGLDFNFDKIGFSIKMTMLSFFAPEIYKQLQNYEKLLSGGSTEVTDGSESNENQERLDEEQKEKLKEEVDSYMFDMLKKVNPDIKEENYNKFFDEWWDIIKKNGIKLNQPFNQVMEKVKSGNISSISNMIELLGFGSYAVIEFLSIGYKHGIIDLKSLSINIAKQGAETGVDLVQQSVMFFPNVMGMALGQVSLNEVLDFLKEKESIPDEYREPLLVMVYRALNTGAGSVLKEIAALPGYAASLAAGQIGEDVSKLKLIREGIFDNKIDQRISTLAELENQLNGVGIYENMKNSLTDYRKGLALSSTYSLAENGEDFINKLSQFTDANGNALYNSSEITNLGDKLVDGKKLSQLNEREFQKGFSVISNTIKSYADQVRIPEGQNLGVSERASEFFKGMFGQKNLTKKVSDDLASSLERNAKVIANDDIFSEKMLRPINKLKAGLDASKTTNGIDIAKLQDSTESPLEKIRTLAKQSPEMLKFLFGEFPVLLLGHEQLKKMAEELSNGDLSGATGELVKTFAYLTPIVGPITFVGENMEEINLEEIGVGAIWLTVDGYILAKSKNIIDEFKYGPRAIRNLTKMTSQGFVGAWTLGRDIGRSLSFEARGGASLLNSVKSAFRAASNKPKIVVAAIVSAVGVRTTTEVAEQFEVSEEELKNELQAIDESGGSKEDYIRQKWNNGEFNEEQKSHIVKLTLMNYLPITNPETIDDIIFTEEGVEVVFNRVSINGESEYPIKKETIVENEGRFESIFNKNVKFRLV